MHNIPWRIYEIPIETKKQNEWPRRLEGTTSNSKEWLKEIVAKGFLTEDEEKFFDELQNPVEIKDIAKKIISELCKRICDWENPSRILFEQVCNDITRMRNGMYPWYTKAVLGQLPDWKKIADLFESDNTGSYDSVKEFREKRKTYMNSKINPLHASPDDPIREEAPVNPEQIKDDPIHKERQVNSEPKKEKVAAQYEAIDYHTYKKDYINNIVKTQKDIETDVPLLTANDVCISSWFGWSFALTKNTRVPFVEWRDYDENENFKKLWIEKTLINNETISYKIDGVDIKATSEPYCFYDPKYDITHICKFGDPSHGRGWQLSASLSITIKGKVSESDAKDLFNQLEENNNLRFSLYDGTPNNRLDDYNRASIQQQVVDYFNNK